MYNGIFTSTLYVETLSFELLMQKLHFKCMLDGNSRSYQLLTLSDTFKFQEYEQVSAAFRDIDSRP